MIERFDLTGLAYYYRGLNNNSYERLGSTMIVGSSLLTGQGIPIAGEYDVKNCVAMLMADRLEAGGSFAEIHPCDFEHDIVLVGHDGPHHIGVAQGRPVLRSLSVYHGKRGSGVGVEFQIKNGNTMPVIRLVTGSFPRRPPRVITPQICRAANSTIP